MGDISLNAGDLNISHTVNAEAYNISHSKHPPKRERPLNYLDKNNS